MFSICVLFYSEAFQNTETNDGDQGLMWSKVFCFFLDKNRVFCESWRIYYVEKNITPWVGHLSPSTLYL